MAVKVYISMVILQFILECQCSECNFANSAHKIGYYSNVP